MEYYAKESAAFLASHNVIDYMKKCETRIGEEVSRSNNYLEERTKKPLLEVLNAALIEKHANEMYDQFLVLLEQIKLIIFNVCINYLLEYKNFGSIGQYFRIIY